MSPDGWLLAYSVDHDGSEEHELRVRDLRTGDDLPMAVPGTSYGVAWSADSGSLLYTTLDPARRPWRVHTHHLGSDPAGADDALVLEEPDDRFWVGLAPSRSGELIVIDVSSAVTSEVHLVDAHAPEAGARLAIARRQDVEVQVVHHGDWLYLVSNDEALDFALWRAPVAAPDRSRWQPVIPHSPGTRLLGVEAFAHHLVVHLRTEGRPALRLLHVDALEATGDDPPTAAAVAAATRDLTFPDAGYSLSGAANEEWEADAVPVRLPVAHHPADRRRGGRGHRGPHRAEADAGARRVRPRRLPHRPGVGHRVRRHPHPRLDRPPPRRGPGRDRAAWCCTGTAPTRSPWTPGSPSPGCRCSTGAWCSPSPTCGEAGRWAGAGTRTASCWPSPHSFSDLVAAADHLAAEGWCAPDRIALRGGSAGGLLVGAALNLAPDRFRAVVGEVPFVDALNTILDPDAPLTATEWEEWGNPITDPEVFATMRAYSPTENIGSGPYPAVLATAGLSDPRVGVHEPAIWVQRLRERTDVSTDRPVLLQVEMGAGHGGPSGRYEAWRKEAEVLAFLLTALGVSSSEQAPRSS